jgi:uncharacterized damage-inducible protein DinB
VLLEAFRHNAWATKQLLAFCRGLSAEQLTTPASGTYGGILATFNHLILSEAGYIRAPAGSRPAWAVNNEESRDLDELVSRVEETAQIWEQSLSEPVDAERVLLVDNGAYEVREGVILAQALYHGNAHREQICTILTALGLEPPDIQAWEHAWATGRTWEANTDR